MLYQFERTYSEYAASPQQYRCSLRYSSHQAGGVHQVLHYKSNIYDHTKKTNMKRYEVRADRGCRVLLADDTAVLLAAVHGHTTPRGTKYTALPILNQRQTRNSHAGATRKRNSRFVLFGYKTYCCSTHTSAPGVRVTTGDKNPRAGASSARQEATIPAETIVRYMYGRRRGVWRA